MPIGDLLASITGEPPKATPVASKFVSPGPKRKAEDDLRGSVKRSGPPATNSSRLNGDSPLPSPRLPDRPGGPTNGRSSVSSKPAMSDSSATERRTLSTAARGSASAALSKPVPARPAVKTGPPKKGSFQEIMARAQAAQETRASFGKIQHKTIERSLTMKERKEMKAQQTRSARKTPVQASQKPSRGAPSRNGSGAGRTTGNENSVGSLSKPPGFGKGKKPSPVETEVKKVKKAATATTGYTGTARPRPQAASKSGSAGRASSESKEKSRPRYPAALSGPRRRYDDYDEELDDFIEYDDDENEPSYERRGGYESLEDDESDMEAGMSDIDQEERRADQYARREDQEQEALERRLKREKEERKRQYLKGGGR